jgi:hypothetical protein
MAHNHPNRRGHSRGVGATEAESLWVCAWAEGRQHRFSRRIRCPAANRANIRSNRRPIAATRPYSKTAMTLSNRPRPAQFPTARNKAPKTTGRLKEGGAVRRSMMRTN